MRLQESIKINNIYLKNMIKLVLVEWESTKN